MASRVLLNWLLTLCVINFKDRYLMGVKKQQFFPLKASRCSLPFVQLFALKETERVGSSSR